MQVSQIVKLMVDVERDGVKRSQHRNMRILSGAPDQCVPQTVIALVQQEAVCQVTNHYGSRVQGSRPFVPFRYNSEVKCSAVVCTEKRMPYYQSFTQAMNVKTLFLTSSKQIKQMASQGVEYLSSYELVIVAPQRVKELRTLLGQSCEVKECDSERQLYLGLIHRLNAQPVNDQSIGEQAASLKTVLEQLEAGQQPTFVVQEDVCNGWAFQRVIVDPSALSMMKHELFGKFLWIVSSSRLLQPQTFTGEFWRRIRSFVPLKQSINDVTVKAYEVVFKAFAQNLTVNYRLFQKNKESLSLLPTNKSQLNIRELLNKYEVESFVLSDSEQLSTAIRQKISAVAPQLRQEDQALRSQIEVTASNASALAQRVIENDCCVCEKPGHRVIYMCCANSPCFACFSKLAQSPMGNLKCFVCRANLGTAIKSQLISVLLNATLQHEPSVIQIISRPALLDQMKQSQEHHYEILTADLDAEFLDFVHSAAAKLHASQQPLVINVISSNDHFLDRFKSKVDSLFLSVSPDVISSSMQ